MSDFNLREKNAADSVALREGRWRIREIPGAGDGAATDGAAADAFSVSTGGAILRVWCWDAGAL